MRIPFGALLAAATIVFGSLTASAQTCAPRPDSPPDWCKKRIQNSPPKVQGQRPIPPASNPKPPPGGQSASTPSQQPAGKTARPSAVQPQTPPATQSAPPISNVSTTTRPTSNASSTPTSGRPAPSSQIRPASTHFAPNPPASVPAAPPPAQRVNDAVSGRRTQCVTAMGACPINVTALRGVDCWCSSASGPVPGRTQ